MPARAVVVALGTIAHQAVLRGPSCAFADYRFRHGARHRLPNGLTLVDSYHCSRYNTQTRRLTPAMFVAVFKQAKLCSNYDRTNEVGRSYYGKTNERK